MIKNLILFTTLGMFTLISCTPAQKESKQPEIQQPTQFKQHHQEQVKELTADTTSTGSANLPISAQSVSKVKLNPPHGQPGHRCEIPVGSPLDPTPANAAPEIDNSAPTAPTTAPAAAPVVRINPPHGEPGHRCEIPVGSPLE